MPMKYVVGNRSDGKSDILAKHDITVLPEYAPGAPGMDLWLNTETPADLSGTEDPVAGKPITHEPPDGGAVFRIVHFMPNSVRKLTPESMLAGHAALKSVHVPSLEELRAAKHPSMHKTDTLNYFVVTSGEVWMLTEGEDVLLKAGDAIIQKGCMHGWRNDSDKPCVLLAVLIDALPA